MTDTVSLSLSDLRALYYGVLGSSGQSITDAEYELLQQYADAGVSAFQMFDLLAGDSVKVPVGELYEMQPQDRTITILGDVGNNDPSGLQLCDPEQVPENARVVVRVADFGHSSSIFYKDPVPSPPFIDMSGVIVAINAQSLGTIDFEANPTTVSFELDGEPVDVVVDSGVVNMDDFGEVAGLIVGTFIGALTDAGAIFNFATSVFYGPDAGADHTFTLTDGGSFFVGQTEMPGYDGWWRGAGDSVAGGLNYDTFVDPIAGYGVAGVGIHNHTNNAQAQLRTSEFSSVHAINNSGRAKWTAIHYPVRPDMLEKTIPDGESSWYTSLPANYDVWIEQIAQAVQSLISPDKFPSG